MTEPSLMNPHLGKETSIEARVRINNVKKRKREAKVLSAAEIFRSCNSHFVVSLLRRAETSALVD